MLLRLVMNTILLFVACCTAGSLLLSLWLPEEECAPPATWSRWIPFVGKYKYLYELQEYHGCLQRRAAMEQERFSLLVGLILTLAYLLKGRVKRVLRRAPGLLRDLLARPQRPDTTPCPVAATKGTLRATTGNPDTSRDTSDTPVVMSDTKSRETPNPFLEAIERQRRVKAGEYVPDDGADWWRNNKPGRLVVIPRRGHHLPKDPKEGHQEPSPSLPDASLGPSKSQETPNPFLEAIERRRRVKAGEYVPDDGADWWRNNKPGGRLVVIPRRGHHLPKEEHQEPDASLGPGSAPEGRPRRLSRRWVWCVALIGVMISFVFVPLFLVLMERA